jgi:uncharacterized membrane protein
MQRKGYWIGGTVTALLGVALVRLLSPAIAGPVSALASVVGYLLVIIGITVLALATRRPDSEPFVTVENEAKD